MEIELTDKERDLFAVLLGCVKHNNRNTTLRCAIKVPMIVNIIITLIHRIVIELLVVGFATSC